MKTKICGVQNTEEAMHAVYYGAWAIGFNFYPDSPRCLDKSQAKSIIRALPNQVLKVGVMPNMQSNEVVSFKNELGLDLLQVYEDIDVAPIVKKNMILALALNTPDELPKRDVLQQYGYLLIDAPPLNAGRIGGTGRLSDWGLAKQLSTSYRVILAGGLTPKNVGEAVRTVHPFAVDVASGVEFAVGKKSPELVKEFLNEVNDVT